jgi:hypothetical protein
LSDFKLHVLRAPNNRGSITNTLEFENWFVALNHIKNEIDQIDFDICLIGCGAFGFPLAAHVKNKGKKAFHLGGSLQMLFGIIGSRWENPNYHPLYNYSNLINQYWIRPLASDITKSHSNFKNDFYN